MSKTVEIVRALAATTKRTEKEQIVLDAWLSGERDFFVGCKMAYDQLLSFGVKKVAEIQVEAGDDDTESSYTFDDFLKLASKLSARQLTGNAARDALHDAAQAADPALWNEFYRRILLKDLRCGITDTTINKMLEKIAKSDRTALDYLVPVFSCQLAKDGADPSNAKHVKGKKMLDPKLDGVRLLTVLNKEENSVTQYTRNGKVNANFTHITDSLAKLLPEIPESIVLDGEIVSKSFQDLMTQVNRKDAVDTAETKLALFDIVPLADFRKGLCKTKQKDRHSLLSSYQGKFQEYCGPSVYVIPKLTVDLDTPEGKKAFAEFNRETVEAGYEGIMVKDPEAPYETKRAIWWLKVKPFIEVSLEIYGFEEGTGKYEGMLGNLLCRGTDDGRYIEVSVGSGLSDEQRKDFWLRKQELMGFIAEIKADALTKERNSEDVWSLRFPRFKGLRGTVPGEKL